MLPRIAKVSLAVDHMASNKPKALRIVTRCHPHAGDCPACGIAMAYHCVLHSLLCSSGLLVVLGVCTGIIADGCIQSEVFVVCVRASLPVLLQHHGMPTGRASSCQHGVGHHVVLFVRGCICQNCQAGLG